MRMAVRAGRLGAIYANVSGDEGFVSQAPTVPDETYTRYQIADQSMRYFKLDQGYTWAELESYTWAEMESFYWIEPEDLAVWVNGSLVTSEYRVESAGGVVVFDTPRSPSDDVRVSARYTLVEQVGGFFDWSMDKALAIEEAPEFGSGWRQRLAVLRDMSAVATKFWVSDGFFEGLKNMGGLVIVVLYVDATPGVWARYEGYARVEGVTIDTPRDELVRSRITFRAYGPWYYREG